MSENTEMDSFLSNETNDGQNNGTNGGRDKTDDAQHIGTFQQQINDEAYNQITEISDLLTYLTYADTFLPQKGWTGKLARFACAPLKKVPELSKMFGLPSNEKIIGSTRLPLNAPQHWIRQLVGYKRMLNCLYRPDKDRKSVTLLVAGTGCGKTIGTIGAFLQKYTGNFFKCLFIVPNKLAASKLHDKLEDDVFYGTFKHYVGVLTSDVQQYGDDTTILIVTPGIAMILMQNQFNFTHVVVDEVHERSLAIQFVLFKMKEFVSIASNTLQVFLLTASRDSIDPIKAYFSELSLIDAGTTLQYKCGIIYWSDVKNHHFLKQGATLAILQQLDEMCAENNEIQTQEDENSGTSSKTIVNDAFDAIEFIVNGNVGGSVLVFVPGRTVMTNLREKLMNDALLKNKIFVKQIHSQYQDEEVVVHANRREIIISTNIAESSITLPSVSFVVDSTFHVVPELIDAEGFLKLKTIRISQSNAIQRKGRVARVKDGWYITLCSKEEFDEIESTVLFPKSLTEDPYEHMLMLLNNNYTFETLRNYVDPIYDSTIDTGVDALLSMKMIEKENNRYKLTNIGIGASQIVLLSPDVSLLLLIGTFLGCQSGCVKLASSLLCDVKHIIHKRDKASESDYRKFVSKESLSEHIALIKSYTKRKSELLSIERKRGQTSYSEDKKAFSKLVNIKSMNKMEENNRKINLVLERIGLVQKGNDFVLNDGDDIALLISILGAFGTCVGRLKKIVAKRDEYGYDVMENWFATVSKQYFCSETDELHSDDKNDYFAVYYRMSVFSDKKAFGPVTIVKPFFYACFAAIGTSYTYTDGKFIFDSFNDEGFKIAMPPELYGVVDKIRDLMLQGVFHMNEKPIGHVDLINNIIRFAKIAKDFDIPVNDADNYQA